MFFGLSQPNPYTDSNQSLNHGTNGFHPPSSPTNMPFTPPKPPASSPKQTLPSWSLSTTRPTPFPSLPFPSFPPSGYNSEPLPTASSAANPMTAPTSSPTRPPRSGYNSPNPLFTPASAIALSFTPSTFNFHSHFQLVCAVVPEPSHPCHPLYFEIYSSRTNSWRVAESFYVNDGHGFVFRSDGFCINGSYVYWELSSGIALIFNLDCEVCGDIELPRLGEGALTEIRGELCYVVATRAWNCNQYGEVGAEGYLLCVFGGCDMRLRFQVALEIGDCLGEDFDGEVRVLSCMSDGFVMILVGRNVVLYDVEKRKGKVMRSLVDTEEHLDGDVGRFLPYVNSLVSVCPVDRMPPEDTYGEGLIDMDIG